MKSKKAEFNKQLADYDTLMAIAMVNSSLFDPLPSTDYTEEWKPDYEQIWRLLHRNYTNPKAMNCFIFYDITDNKLRIKLAKYLLEKGAQRIQKSVFLANISKAIYNEIYETIASLEPIYDDSDSVMMVPIGEFHLAEMNMVGKDVEMSFSRSSEHVIFI